jgi:phospholipase C
MDADSSLSRRSLLKGMAALGAAAAIGDLAGCSSSAKHASPPAPSTSTTTLPPVLRKPGSLPFPNAPEGTDMLPQIEHIVVMMQENHSFDNYFGMLGRGDGFKLDAAGKPVDANPYNGKLLRAFHMPSACQLHAHPGQDWFSSHTSWNHGRNDGFVKASGPVAMGYWDETDLPFYYGFARTFPVCDRWFCSVLAQTYPNRRFLLAGTASGIVTTTDQALNLSPPPNGTIFDRLHAHGITWADYYTDLPFTAVIPVDITPYAKSTFKPISQFAADAAAGKLPSISFVDPSSGNSSEENPQDIHNGETFSAHAINAVLHSPLWPKTMLIFTYDEHGGYYDHVPPPPAVKPDKIPPGADLKGISGAYDRYGFRVPAVIASPYAKKNYVSSVVHDHTSVLKLIETKWNLPAMTYRDANADNLLDAVDFNAPPAFVEPPTLPAPSDAPPCTPGDPGGPIPPADAVVPASDAASLRIGATA